MYLQLRISLNFTLCSWPDDEFLSQAKKEKERNCYLLTDYIESLTSSSSALGGSLVSSSSKVRESLASPQLAIGRSSASASSSNSATTDEAFRQDMPSYLLQMLLHFKPEMKKKNRKHNSRTYLLHDIYMYLLSYDCKQTCIPLSSCRILASASLQELDLSALYLV